MMSGGVAALREAESNETPIQYTLNGQKKQMMFATLSSGWKLIVAAPVSEINAPWLHLIRGVAIISAIILILFSQLTFVLLKLINDTYGHEKGDIYLKTACNAICDVFRHSPVFRMGGDEFAVLLQG